MIEVKRETAFASCAADSESSGKKRKAASPVRASQSRKRGRRRPNSVSHRFLPRPPPQVLSNAVLFSCHLVILSQFLQPLLHKHFADFRVSRVQSQHVSAPSQFFRFLCPPQPMSSVSECCVFCGLQQNPFNDDSDDSEEEMEEDGMITPRESKLLHDRYLQLLRVCLTSPVLPRPKSEAAQGCSRLF